MSNGDDRPTIEKISLDAAFTSIDDHWSPRLAGELTGQAVKLAMVEGEFVIVPRGVEHGPVADEETEVLLVEPLETRNTGNVESTVTRSNVETLE